MATYGVKLQRSDYLRLPARSDTCTRETFLDWCRARRERGERLAVDLFSGAGGLSLGLSNAGWTVAAAIDHDRCALETHTANFAGLTLGLDLGNHRQRNDLIRLLQQADIDLVAGGPPCQPFSRAGRSKIRSLVDAGVRQADDHRRELWRSFVDVVEKVRPRAVVMENVPDMALGDDLRVVRQIVERFEACGYRTQVRLVDAWQYGVPQHRQRMILLARRDGGRFTWPDPVESITTLEQAIGDLPALGEGTGARRLEHSAEDLSPFAKGMRQDADPGVVYDHMTRPVRDDDRVVFQMMDSKTLYSDIPEELRRYKAETFDDKYKRLGWRELSRSITAHIARDGYWYIHPQEHRTLTVREAARIQTFPDWFRFAGTRSDAFRQIGNAVPPMLGEAAATAVSPLPTDSQPPSSDAVVDWRSMHRRLAQWAGHQRSREHWYLFPGEDVTLAVALLVTVLRAVPGLSVALAPVRGKPRFDTADLDEVEKRLATATARAAIARLRPLAENVGKTSWNDRDGLASAARLKSAEVELFLMLSGEDVLISGQAAVRVAARVLNTTSDRFNRRSLGRVDLARLVGSGKSAPSRMAAIRLLGVTLCGSQRPDAWSCSGCPLRGACLSAPFAGRGQDHSSGTDEGSANLTLPFPQDSQVSLV